MTDIITINARNPEAELIERAANYLREGMVVAYPTETFYGLGVDFSNVKAIKRLYELKRRDPGLPIALLVADDKMLETCVANTPPPAKQLMRSFWPGPLTMCFPAADSVPRDLTTNTGKIGIRISSHPVAAALVKALGRPITTTSANLSGFPPSFNIKHIKKYFHDKLSCMIDSGECIGPKGSTVVDLSEDTMAVIRDGAIPSDEVIKCFQRE